MKRQEVVDREDTMILVLLVGIVLILLSGCGVQASIYPVDQTEVSYQQSDMPMKCRFWTFEGCNNRGAK